MKAALLLCAGLLAFAAQAQFTPLQPSAPPSAQPVTQPPQPLLRDALVPPLRAAQEALAAGKYTEALSQLALTDGVAGKTPVETYFIERLRAAAASGARDTAQAARSLEAALASGQTPRADQPALMEALAIAHYNLKHYGEAALWASRYVEQGGSKQEIRLMRAQALYLAGDFRGAALQLQGLQREYQAAGTPVPESQLDMLAGSYIKLGDDAGYMQVLEQLLRSYPRPDYWADLLVRLERRPGFSPELVIDLFRLQFAANALAEAGEYLELAQLAAQAGFPAEAKKVLDAGFAAKLLGTGPDADKHLRYRQQVDERVQAEGKALDAPERQPAAAKDNDALFKLGQTWVAQGRMAQGLVLMQQALDKGGLAQPGVARLRLAATLAQANNKPAARELLQPLQASAGADAANGTTDLARLWGILIAR